MYTPGVDGDIEMWYMAEAHVNMLTTTCSRTAVHSSLLLGTQLVPVETLALTASLRFAPMLLAAAVAALATP